MGSNESIVVGLINKLWSLHNAMVANAITGLIFVIIGVVLLTSLALTVNTSTADNEFNSTGDDNAAGALENVSADAKSLYGLFDLIWAAGGLVLIVAGLFTIAKSFGRN